MKFHIDPELQRLIPPLSAEEYSALERSILDDGVRDPLVVWSNNRHKPILIDGHHRWKIIQKHRIQKFQIVQQSFDSRNEAKIWIIENQCARRNLPAFTRCELYLQKAELLRERAKENQRLSQGRGKKVSMNSCQPFHVDIELAKECGVSKQTLQRVRNLTQNADKDTIAALRSGQTSVNEAFKKVRLANLLQNRQEQRVNGVQEFRRHKPDENWGVIHADFRKFSKTIEDNSVDLILTDPPYALESVPLYGDLARVAARILKVGGSLVAYSGNRYLPDVLAVITPHLKFYWTLACLHTGGTQHEDHRRNIGVINCWKPLLWFVKEKRGDRLTFVRDAIQSEMDKNHHAHGQSLVEAKYLIESLTKPNDLVFDPLCGGGTVAVAAKDLKRRWMACDVDAAAVETARRRLREDS